MRPLLMSLWARRARNRPPLIFSALSGSMLSISYFFPLEVRDDHIIGERVAGRGGEPMYIVLIVRDRGAIADGIPSSRQFH